MILGIGSDRRHFLPAAFRTSIGPRAANHAGRQTQGKVAAVVDPDAVASYPQIFDALDRVIRVWLACK